MTALLISIGFNLDIWDGKIARKYNQCTILGDGVDWLGDIMNDVLLMIWVIDIDRQYMIIITL